MSDFVPTAEQTFGPKPWMDNPTVTGPEGDYTLNAKQFATPSTAAKVLAILGGYGKVVPAFSFESSGLSQQHTANLMIQLSNNALINAGKVAAMFNGRDNSDIIRTEIVNEVVKVSMETLGLVVDPASVSVVMPDPPAAPVAPSIFPGSFYRRINTDQFVMGFPPNLSKAEADFFVAFFDKKYQVGEDQRNYLGECHLTSPLSDAGHQQPTGTWTAVPRPL